jgi:hypothetical protein
LKEQKKYLSFTLSIKNNYADGNKTEVARDRVQSLVLILTVFEFHTATQQWHTPDDRLTPQGGKNRL